MLSKPCPQEDKIAMNSVPKCVLSVASPGSGAHLAWRNLQAPALSLVEIQARGGQCGLLSPQPPPGEMPGLSPTSTLNRHILKSPQTKPAASNPWDPRDVNPEGGWGGDGKKRLVPGICQPQLVLVDLAGDNLGKKGRRMRKSHPS